MDSKLTLDDYQKMALETAMYSSDFKVIYPALGITGEAGEVSDKVKKLIRDKGFKNASSISIKDKDDIVLELGDVLWYVAIMGSDLGYSLEEIAWRNYSKLQNRKNKNVLGGSGDHRGEEDYSSACSPSRKILFRSILIDIIAFMVGVLIGCVLLVWKFR